MACFTNITGADTDYEFAPSSHSQTAGEYLTDSLGSDSDKLFEDFGALAMKQIPLQKKKNKSQKVVVKE